MKTKQVLVTILLCTFCFLLGTYLESRERKLIASEKDVAKAEKLIGLAFNKAERKMMLEDVSDLEERYQSLRTVSVPDEVFPALLFDPVPTGMKVDQQSDTFSVPVLEDIALPGDRNELAYYPITKLSELIRRRKITSVQLTKLYLERLKKYGPKLECVVTLTEDLAMQQASLADQEIAAGKYRGMLHGIPYGAKDLLDTKGIPTTWGTAPYIERVPQSDATVIRLLEEAGAVLVAKLTLGELAWGDVWFGGKTRNPWNYEQGSSGSSAGSASATSAGLVPFAIGSETWGSIVSPSTRCGVTGLRPSYGRVSRTGAMALSWSMDKLGPICRNVEDCAIVFNAIYGPDGEDPTVYDVPFHYDPHVTLKGMKVGYLKKDFEREDDEEEDESRQNDEGTLAKLREMGAHLVPIELPDLPIDAMSIILDVESGAAFDEFLRSGEVNRMKRQEKDAWPNVFRYSRFIPAVEYVQANRIRRLLILEMEHMLQNVDLYLAPSFKGDNLLLTNLTGHPCVVVPNGFKKDGTPTSITFVGKLFAEGDVLAVAKLYQDATDFHLQRPVLHE